MAQRFRTLKGCCADKTALASLPMNDRFAFRSLDTTFVFVLFLVAGGISTGPMIIIS
jgi:hypothetical protein